VVYEIVRVLELNPIPVSKGGDPIRLRVEVLKDLSRRDCYRARLLRWDTYSVAPSFGNPSGTKEADEEILVVDPLWDSMSAAASSAREALDLVLSRLREQLPNAAIPGLDVVDW
jgi:hypothetical protein